MFTVDPSIHLLRETEVVRSLRRELDDPTLFTFWNIQASKWSLGYWTWKDRGKADLLHEGLGNRMDVPPSVDRELIQKLRSMRGTPDFKKTRSKLIEAQRRVWRYQMDQNEEKQDQRDFLRGRGGDQPYFQ